MKITTKHLFICIVIVLILFAAIWVYHQRTIGNNIKENCKKTEYYSISDKGYSTRVYNCKGVTIND